jgi:hypothetical protein
MELTPFVGVDATSLRWLRSRDSPLEFDLLAGDPTIGTLRWDGPAGTRATFRTAAQSWTLKRVGFLNPQVTVRSGSPAENAARLTVHWNYHQIEVTGGPTYRFHRAGVLVPAWQVTDASGHEVLHVEPVREGRKLVAGAAITPADVTKRPEFPLLLSISWYFIVLAWFEDEALVPFEGPDAPPTAGA